MLVKAKQVVLVEDLQVCTFAACSPEYNDVFIDFNTCVGGLT